MLGTDRPVMALGALVLGWFLVAVARRRHDLRALVVDDRGVRIRRALVPWPDVREVGLVLRPGARLASGLTALVRDPDPDAVPTPSRRHCGCRRRAGRSTSTGWAPRSAPTAAGYRWSSGGGASVGCSRDAAPLLLLAVVPALLVVAGVVVVGSGVRAIVVARRFLWVAQQVPGTVSDHRYQVHRRAQSHRRRVVTVPVLRFTTRAGQPVEAQQVIALRSGAPERGAQVGVLYDPADPADPARGRGGRLDQRDDRGGGLPDRVRHGVHPLRRELALPVWTVWPDLAHTSAHHWAR